MLDATNGAPLVGVEVMPLSRREQLDDAGAFASSLANAREDARMSALSFAQGLSDEPVLCLGRHAVGTTAGDGTFALCYQLSGWEETGGFKCKRGSGRPAILAGCRFLWVRRADGAVAIVAVPPEAWSLSPDKEDQPYATIRVGTLSVAFP